MDICDKNMFNSEHQPINAAWINTHSEFKEPVTDEINSGLGIPSMENLQYKCYWKCGFVKLCRETWHRETWQSRQNKMI